MSELLSRVIILSCNVDEISAGKIIDQIYKINEEDDRASTNLITYTRKPITMIVNSYGGSANAMFAIISVMTASKTPIYTHIPGNAQSAGVKIAMCGAKGHRTASQWAEIMIHDAYCHIQGKTVTLRTEMEQVETLNAKLNKLFSTYSKVTPEMFKEFTESAREVYLTPEKALEFGIIDEIISNDDRIIE